MTGDLKLDKVKFFYPTRPEVKVMKETTITAGAGQTVALVGQSGCGKSTSVALLERFYDPVDGVVVSINVFVLSETPGYDLFVLSVYGIASAFFLSFFFKVFFFFFFCFPAL